MNDEPETTNDEIDGECGECLLGAPVRAAYGIDPGDVGGEPATGPSSGEDAYSSVAGAAVGLDDVRGEAGVVSNYLSILTL